MPRHDAEYEYGTIVKGTTLDTPTITIEHNTPDNYETLALNNGIEIERSKSGEILGYTYVQTVSELTDDGYQDRVYRVNMVPEKDASSTSDNVIINYKPSGAYRVDQQKEYQSGGTTVIINREEYLKSSLKAVGVNLELGQVDPAQVDRLWEIYTDTTKNWYYDPKQYPDWYAPIGDLWNKTYGFMKETITGQDDVNYKYFTRADSFAKILEAAAQVGWFDFDAIVEDDPETKAYMMTASVGDFIQLKSPFNDDNPVGQNWAQSFIRPLLYYEALQPGQASPDMSMFENYTVGGSDTRLIPVAILDDLMDQYDVPCDIFITGKDFAQVDYKMSGIYAENTNFEIIENHPQHGYAKIRILATGVPRTTPYYRQLTTGGWQGYGRTQFTGVDALLVYSQADYMEWLNTEPSIAYSSVNGSFYIYANVIASPGGNPGITHDPDYIRIDPEDDPDDILRKVEDQYPDWWDDTIPEPTYDPPTDTTPTIRYIPIGVGTPTPRVEDPAPTVITGGYPEWIHATVPTIPGLPEPKEETIAPVKSNRFWTIYKPSESDMDQLGSKLWDQNVIDMLLQTFQNPTDGIIGFGQVYFNPSSSRNSNIIMGNYDTQISAPVLDSNHYVVNYSKTVTIPRYFNDYRDYTETEVTIYLPFVGIQELDPLEVVGYSLKLRYDVDLLTGTCVAQVISYPTEETLYKDSKGAIAHYMFTGNCMVQLPITARDRSQLLTGLLSGAVGVASAVGGNIVGGVAQAVGGGIQAVQGLTGKVSKVTGFSANVGALTAYKTPYVTVKRKIPADPMGYEQYYGDPACINAVLGDLTGFVRVKDVFLNIPGATDAEIAQIDALLHSGVRL